MSWERASAVTKTDTSPRKCEEEALDAGLAEAPSPHLPNRLPTAHISLSHNVHLLARKEPTPSPLLIGMLGGRRGRECVQHVRQVCSSELRGRGCFRRPKGFKTEPFSYDTKGGTPRDLQLSALLSSSSQVRGEQAASSHNTHIDIRY